MRKAWKFLVIIVALASAIPKDENTDCSDNQHFRRDFHNVIGEDNGKGDVENSEEGNMKAFKLDDKDRKPKQLQFSRLMERCVAFFFLIVRCCKYD